MRVACLGPEASFTHQATLAHFGSDVLLSAMRTIPEVFEAVEREEVSWGVVPIENSLEGSVRETLDRLTTTNMAIRAEVILPISLCLLSAQHDRGRIRKISSHPHAFAQCRAWLGRHLPEIRLEPAESTAAAASEELLALGADRDCGLIALGGGVVGDLTGFVASTFMRGLPLVQIPTTLVAQVDSSIGGKTAVDLPMGKNLIGTFWQPRMVFIDLSFLETLPSREYANGLAEIAKYGIVDDVQLFRELQDKAGRLLGKDMELLESVVAWSCRIKKAMVEMDETDKGVRRFLNFGHTVGHALEAESGYAISHGEAVSIGMAAAVTLSRRMNYLPAPEEESILALIRSLGLPHRIPTGLSTASILSRLRVDKKKSGDRVNFILLKSLGIPFVNGGVSQTLVGEVLEGLKG